MTACLTSPTHGPAVAMGVCSTCAEWLRTARGVGGLALVTLSKPTRVDQRALRERFASVRTVGGGRIGNNRLDAPPESARISLDTRISS